MADQVVSIDQVEFDPTNARRRTERSSYMIRSSLEQFGPLRSLVGQRLPDGRIVVKAGNGTLEEAGQVGIDKVRIVERKPDELVIVVADDLDEGKWTQYAIADNRSSDLSDWDIPTLQETHDEVDLSAWFTKSEILDWQLDDDGGVDWGGEDAEDPFQSSGMRDADKYPLPIVLTWKEKQAWDDFKKSAGITSDKKALIDLLERHQNGSD